MMAYIEKIKLINICRAYSNSFLTIVGTGFISELIVYIPFSLLVPYFHLERQSHRRDLLKRIPYHFNVPVLIL